MRIVSIVFAAWICFLQHPADAQVSNEEILEEVRTLRTEVELLRAEIKELKNSAPTRDEHSLDDFTSKGADHVALSKIKLPENPTDDEVSEYVRQIVEISDKQNSFSNTDPQPYMLAQVGPEYVEFLLDVMQSRQYTLSFMYFVSALQRIVSPEHKELILSRLPVNHALVEVVLFKGWTNDARDILIDQLRVGARQLPEEWIQAVAELKDPTTYELLQKALLTSYHPHLVYDHIASLEGIELDAAVDARWKSMRNGDSYRVDMFAGIAAQYGNLDALEHLINLLDEPTDYWWGDRGPVRQQVLQVIEFQGTNNEIKSWFHQNLDELVFDPNNHTFVLRE